MAYISIRSKNPDFSHIMMKNPATIKDSGKPFMRSLRKGKVSGWYSENNSCFNFWFVDSETEVSFSDKPEYEYLDTSRYSHPFLLNQIITEFARNAVNGVPEYDKEYEDISCTVTSAIKIRHSLLEKLNTEGDIEYELKQGNWAKVTVSGKSVSQALNKFMLMTILSTIDLDDLYVPLNVDVVTRYLKMMNKANAGYSLRHLFISRVVTNTEIMERLNKEGLIDTEKYHFEMGNSQRQRFMFLKSELQKGPRGTTLIDIGCGELSHSIKLSGDYAEIYAYEKDEAIHQSNVGRVAKRKIENIHLFNTEVTSDNVLDLPTDGADIILSEVLEHMPKYHAERLLYALFNTKFNKILITLPNAEFNKHYGMEEGEIRHEDHDWEPTFNDVVSLMLKASVDIPRAPFYNIVPVGDYVKEGNVGADMLRKVPATFGIIVTPYVEQEKF